LTVNGTLVRQVGYAYYDGTDGNGNIGDLKTAQVEDGSGNVLDTDYHRYGRRITRHDNPSTGRRHSSQDAWVIRLTRNRKAKGTTACGRSGGRGDPAEAPSRKPLMAWPRLYCLKPNPGRSSRRPAARRAQCGDPPVRAVSYRPHARLARVTP